jgi:threonine dehydrogenase-like Zn-dependent dehydrogenase
VEAIQYTKSIPRYLAMRHLGKRWRSLYTSPFSCTRLVDIPEPQLPTPEWIKVRTRLSGICGSDLATITAKGSPYFSPFTSTPFVLGHEIVGEVAETGAAVEGFRVGRRVVIEPVLSCSVRGISPPCHQCQNLRFANCENITKGDISAGVQTGYCRDTGGGWSQYVLAHQSQLHLVPDDISDEAAVLLEPFACALHGVLKFSPNRAATICVIGGGTIGLLTVAALRVLGHRNRILIFAKYPHQQQLARELGADEVLSPNSGRYAAFCELTGATSHQPELGQQVLIGGVDVTFDCIGSSVAIDDAFRFTRAGGEVILVGMPGIPKNVDWTSIWYKQLKVEGAYTYGLETHNGEQVHTFTLGMRLLQKMKSHLRPLVSTLFPLRDYKRAIQTAMNTGKTITVKTAFDLRM